MRVAVLSISLAFAATAAAQTHTPRNLQVRSPAFAPDAMVPAEYTCDGADLSPPLTWTAPPAATRSVAIVLDDPDASNGTFMHWLVANLPPTTTSLDADAKLPPGVMIARNDNGSTGYFGPCPPSGTHHYRFHVFALDTKLTRVPTSRLEFFHAIDGHVLAEGVLVAVYHKQR